ncbi:MAG: hypothetical protein KGL95_02630 [Patescibacteria group bacterium]|nr:hypothetical protein [Patescibacteria group bacterium]
MAEKVILSLIGDPKVTYLNSPGEIGIFPGGKITNVLFPIEYLPQGMNTDKIAYRVIEESGYISSIADSKTIEGLRARRDPRLSSRYYCEVSIELDSNGETLRFESTATSGTKLIPASNPREATVVKGISSTAGETTVYELLDLIRNNEYYDPSRYSRPYVDIPVYSSSISFDPAGPGKRVYPRSIRLAIPKLMKQAGYNLPGPSSKRR